MGREGYPCEVRRNCVITMDYKVTLTPVAKSSPGATVITGTDGVPVGPIEAGVVTTANMVTLLQQIPGMNASAGQMTALLTYVAAIKAGTDTSAVETAITALS